MSNGELCFEPVFSGRNPKTGRFVKGHQPANKGKKWDEYMSKRNQRKAARGWKNLDIHRHRSENAGRPKKPVIAVMDDIGCDSIDRLEIEIHLEREFAIQFNKDEMIGAGWTVRELCDFMELKL